MALTDEQAKQVKEELFKQLENVPAESRDQIKKQIEGNILPFRQGMKKLEPIDSQLSKLDTEYKTLWDKYH